MKISVIIPFFNTEQYARKCIDSVLASDFNDLELILINDASEDNVLTILREYEAKNKDKVIVLDNKENLGQGGARNRAIGIAKGEYLFFLDSDDSVDPSIFSKLYTKAKEMNANVVESAYFVLFENGKTFLKSPSTPLALKLQGVALKKNLLAYSSPSPWPRLFKASLFKDNNIIFPEKILFEDFATIPLIFLFATKLSYVDEPLYYYYQRSGSSMSGTENERKFIDDSRAVCEILLNKCKVLDKYEEFKEELNFKIIRTLVLQVLIAIFLKFKKVSYEHMSEVSLSARNILGKDYYSNSYLKQSKMIYFIIIFNEKLRPILFFIFVILKPFQKFILIYKNKYKWKK